MLKKIALASVVLLSMLAAGPLAAQTEPPAKAKPKPAKVAAKPKKPAIPAGKIAIDNRRDAVLVELSLTPSGGKSTAPIVVAHDLPAGQKIIVPLPKKAGCVFSVSGSFDDESTVDVPPQNLCKDGAINLVE
jgi:hypothetical protein